MRRASWLLCGLLFATACEGEHVRYVEPTPVMSVTVNNAPDISEER